MEDNAVLRIEIKKCRVYSRLGALYGQNLAKILGGLLKYNERFMLTVIIDFNIVVVAFR